MNSQVSWCQCSASPQGQGSAVLGTRPCSPALLGHRSQLQDLHRLLVALSFKAGFHLPCSILVLCSQSGR